MTSEAAPPSPSPSERLAAAADRPSPGLIREFATFALEHKKWWLIPILCSLLAVAVLILLAGSPLAPFIYPLF